MTLLILYGLLALVVSFICSMLEACLLSLPRSFVESLVAKGSPAGRMLRDMKNNIDRPLAAILTLNTISHTVGAAGVGAQAAKLFGSTAVGIAGAIMTVLILVLSEIIPKTLGAVHVKKLAAPAAYVLRWMIAILLPVIIPLEWLNRLISGTPHGVHLNRAELLATLRLGHDSGALEQREFQITENLLRLRSIPVGQILTPRTVVFWLPAKLPVRDAREQNHPVWFARIPIYAESVEQPVGYVPRFAIHAAHSAGQDETRMEELARPLRALPEFANASEVLDSFIRDKLHLAVVVDEYGGVVGIVTLEDLLETLLGEEIIDETDTATDMQELARQRRPVTGAPPASPRPTTSDPPASSDALEPPDAPDRPAS